MKKHVLDTVAQKNLPAQLEHHIGTQRLVGQVCTYDGTASSLKLQGFLRSAEVGGKSRKYVYTSPQGKRFLSVFCFHWSKRSSPNERVFVVDLLQ